MSKAFGLPGNRGAKAHHFFMRGHADARNGTDRRDMSDKSKAIQKAYTRGYDLGVEQKKAKV